MALVDELHHDANGIAIVGPDEWVALSLDAKVELDLMLRGEGHIITDVLEATFLGDRMLTVTTIVRGAAGVAPRRLVGAR